ncbi:MULTISPECIES: LysR family transcriptional regulator [Stenotrophomonas]|jgi:DNA-binding transcriptional LysR family regulator|uniref:LysR family transcriptional regulator n=1 Tax=Stenotrophomonas TaxID=40323 RepID=UPI0024DF011E|nr:LysR family transcriptional regulator [Stenotrophomonas sp. BIO128-Bstrain]WIA63011.1 LysR family transcriptional regulator [Stenotrophomonas sp. BIO128-Bstrain]
MRGAEFAELKAFVAVVDRSSFAKAADHLGLSRSALSQTIRQLESRLGVRLLNRTTRSVSPTEPGRRLHERMAPMLREMNAAVAEAVDTRTHASGTLRINTLSMAAKRLIAPRLGRFARAHPDVVLDIVIDDTLSDIAGEGFDAGIRVGNRLQKDMVAVRMTPDVELLAVASPEYLARYGEPRTPADLSRHACINWRFPGSGRIAGWEFSKKGKTVEFFGEGSVISNHQDIIVPAALQGLGILYAYNDDDIAEALRDGRLRRVLADWSPTVPGLYLYYSSRRHMLPGLRAFIDCMLDRDLGSEASIPSAHE